MKKALVTGGAGFIGSHVVQQLCEKGIEVRVAALPSENTRNIEHLPVEILRGNILDVDYCNNIIAGADTVFHMAAVYAVWLPDWRTLWEVITRLNQAGHTIMLTTHYLEEAEALCGRVAMLKAGHIVALDTTQALLARVGGTDLEEAFVRIMHDDSVMEAVL